MGFGDFFKGITSVVSSIGSLLVQGAKLIVGAAGQVMTFATSLLTSRAFAPATTGTNASTSASTNARAQAQPNTTTPIPVVYGDAFIGGKFVDACLTTDGQKMFYVLVLSNISAAGEFIYNQSKIYYGDRIVTFDSTDRTKVVSLTDNAGNVDTKINGNMYINLYVSDTGGNISSPNGAPLPWASGTPYSMGDSSGLALAQQWASTNRRMNATAFAIVRLTYNTDAGTTQLSPLTFKCSHYLYNQTCAKPGDVWYDYMINQTYGCAVDPEYVDAVSAYNLNVYSDEFITFNDYNGGLASQPRYRINGVINTAQAVLQNVDQIMVACDSWMQYNATTGKWAVVINKPSEPAFAFDDSNIIGDIKVNSVDITQTPNEVQAKFPDSTNRDQYNYVNESVPEHLKFTNEPVNKASLTYELVNSSVQALYLANRFLEQNREDLLVTINTTYQGIQVDAGDVISVTNAAYGWNAKLFRATTVKEMVNDDRTLGASIQLMEYNPAVYDDKDITEYTPAGNSGLVSANYFSTLDIPVVVDAQPNAPVPSFAVRVTIPTTGRVNFVTLYYTTAAVPTDTDWLVYDTQNLPSSLPFSNGTYLTFNHISLPTDEYYFAYKVGNDVAESNLSTKSSLYNWLPNPASSSVAGVFLASFSPSVLQVPNNNGVPSFAGVVAGLYGTVAGGSVDFVGAQSDSDAGFVNNSWRIGGSSTTGYVDIVTSGVTLADPTDGGTYAVFAPPSNMVSNPATLSVPVRYKNSNGVVSQAATAVLQYNFTYRGATGQAGTKYSTANLYQWSTAAPPVPNGTATFTWADNATSGYTGGNGWSTSLPSNPLIPGILLWQASKAVSAPGADLTTTVDFTVAVNIASVSANGLNGLQTAQPTVYKWALTIPSSPAGTSTYTWATGGFFPVPSGWSTTPGSSPSLGYTLWAATVNLLDSASAVTSTINWGTANVTARGYSGTNGTDGTAGASARICYSKSTQGTISSYPYYTTGSTSFPPNGTWAIDTVWGANPVSPLYAGEYLYQSDGVYDPTTNLTLWSGAYLSNLKVGSLAALSVNTGSLSVTGLFKTANGNFSVDASGNTVIRSGTSGARMELSNNLIQVFDSNGALRVKIGQLS